MPEGACNELALSLDATVASFPNQVTQIFRFVWLNVGWCQSSANCGAKLWLDPALCTPVILPEITVWGGLREACKGQQKKACTNACQKPLKIMAYFSRLVKRRNVLFLWDFLISSSFAWFSKSHIGQLLLVSLRHNQDYKYISDSNNLLIFIAYCSYTIVLTHRKKI